MKKELDSTAALLALQRSCPPRFTVGEFLKKKKNKNGPMTTFFPFSTSSRIQFLLLRCPNETIGRQVDEVSLITLFIPTRGYFSQPRIDDAKEDESVWWSLSYATYFFLSAKMVRFRWSRQPDRGDGGSDQSSIITLENYLTIYAKADERDGSKRAILIASPFYNLVIVLYDVFLVVLPVYGQQEKKRKQWEKKTSDESVHLEIIVRSLTIQENGIYTSLRILAIIIL